MQKQNWIDDAMLDEYCFATLNHMATTHEHDYEPTMAAYTDLAFALRDKLSMTVSFSPNPMDYMWACAYMAADSVVDTMFDTADPNYVVLPGSESLSESEVFRRKLKIAMEAGVFLSAAMQRYVVTKLALIRARQQRNDPRAATYQVTDFGE